MTSSFLGRLSPGCVTGVGSLPFLDADQAVEFVAEHCPELPFGGTFLPPHGGGRA